MKLLIVGGAGYIGSHMVKWLLDYGHTVVTLDNLSSGHRDAVLGGEFIHADLANKSALDQVFRNRQFDSVMHFAAFTEVGESVLNPAKYYKNNFLNTLNLLDAMVAHGVNNFIFSSSAAIFGEPRYLPMDENHPQQPVNPYGRAKWMVEQVLADYDRAYGLKSVALRYFNAAGADPSAALGERHQPETHLIPLVLQTASGQRARIEIFGDDYATPDGTCIRDYVHVTDLCQAHLAALAKLCSDNHSTAYNLGNGNGFSVRQVIIAASKVTGKTIPLTISSRRAGDPPLLIADASLARVELQWSPLYIDLETIIEHAWRAERQYAGRI